MSEPVWHRRPQPDASSGPSPVPTASSGPAAPSRPELHFAEPRPGLLALPRAIADLGLGLLFGLAAVVLLMLVLGIVGEEALPEQSRALDLDAILRGSIGSVFVIIPAGLVLMAIGNSAERLLWPRAIERMRRTDPDAVVPSRVRRRLSSPPGRFVRAFGIGLIVVGSVAALLMIGMAATDSGGAADPITWWVMLGGVVALASGIAVCVAARAIDRRWTTRIAASARRGGDVSRALDADRARREQSAQDEGPALLAPRVDRLMRRITGIAMIPFAVAWIIWFTSVATRQPCRTCEQRTFDESGERALDVASVVAGIGVVVTTAIVAIVALGWLVLAAARQFAAARWVADGRPRHASPERLQWLLLGQSAGVGLARLLAGVAALPLMLAFTAVPLVGIDWSSPLIDAEACARATAALFASALLVSLVDAPLAVSLRNRVRATCSPGDPEIVQRSPGGSTSSAVDQDLANRLDVDSNDAPDSPDSGGSTGD